MKIWLDDLRLPPADFIHVKNKEELETILTVYGAERIEVMSFDHDLGDDTPNGYEIAKWLANEYLNRWPDVLRVHSSNPAGAANIIAFDEFVRKRLL